MNWKVLPEERTRLISPAWFRMFDDFTGGAPIGGLAAHLDVLDGATWRPTDVPGVLTPSGHLSYPGLGRRRVVGGTGPVRHRVRIEARRYRPIYRTAADGLEFDVLAYNDAEGPGAPATRQDVVLVPIPSYAFPSHIPTLHGAVVDQQTSRPVQDALVQNNTTIGTVIRIERALTDERGAFVLPLRWVAAGATAIVTATNVRTGNANSISVTVPTDLGVSHQIAI